MKPIQLIAFDVDGTLVEHPEKLVVWQLMNRRYLGSLEVSDQRYRDFMAGKFDYERWVDLDVSDWMSRGATRAEMAEEVKALELIGGAHETLAVLKERGYKLAVISGTLDLVIEEFFPEHPFEEIFTNKLHFDEAGKLVGAKATNYDMEGKAHALEELAQRFSLSLEECAFVGDHANDVAVAQAAGFSVAFNPKTPRLEEVADHVIRADSLAPVAELFPGSHLCPRKE